MHDLGGVELGAMGEERRPEVLHRMRCDRDAVLGVDRGDDALERLIGAHGALDAERDHVEARGRHLLAGHDERASGRVRVPARGARGQDGVVLRDRDDVEPTSSGLTHDAERRERAVAPARVRVEVAFEDAIAGTMNDRALGMLVAHDAAHDAEDGEGDRHEVLRRELAHRCRIGRSCPAAT